MTDNVRILLLTSMSEKGVNKTPPLGLDRLRFYLEERGIACDVVDFAIAETGPSLAAVGNGAYDIVGMQVTHFQIMGDLDLLWAYRKAAATCGKPVLIMAGGQEATMNYQQWLQLGVDLIGLGFAEQAMYEIAVRVAEHFKANGRNASLDIPGLFGDLDAVAYLDEAQRPVYRPAPLMSGEEFRRLNYTQVKNIDMPHHAYWDLVRAQRADVFVTGERRFTNETVRLYTSSHCPRQCGFCSSQNFFPLSQDQKTPILMLTADEVFDLILHHVDTYGAQAFLFNDDDFAIGNRAGLERFESLSRMIIEAKKSGRIAPDTRFIFQARVADFLLKAKDAHGAHQVNTQLLDLISEAGFRNVGLGVETFSDKLLFAPSINKRVAAAACHDVINAMLKRNMAPQIYIIIGIPESDTDDLVSSMDDAIDYMDKGCDVGMVTQLRAYPGSPLVQNPDYRIACKKWRHPETGKIHEFMDYFIPNDPVMQVVAANIKEEALKELEEVVEKKALHDTKIWPKSLIGVTAFMAAARLMQRDDVYRRYSSYLDKAIQEF